MAISAFGPISALSFDADQTLWDFRDVHIVSLMAAAAAMVQRGDVERGGVKPEQLIAAREEVVASVRGKPHRLEDVRERSFELFLERAGHPAPAEAAAALIDRYMQVRFEQIKLFPEVKDSLERLKQRFPLGLVTNGNTYPDKCGLPGVFDAAVFGPDHGLEKPDPKLFHLLAEQLEVSTGEIVHVGDSADDVYGARAVGAIAVFVNRTRGRPDFAADADFEVRNLLELESLLGASA